MFFEWTLTVESVKSTGGSYLQALDPAKNQEVNGISEMRVDNKEWED